MPLPLLEPALARLWPAAGVTLAAVAGYLYGEASARRFVCWISKPLASAGFIAAAIAAGAGASDYGRVLLAALVLSWWGDVLLLPRTGAWFLAGLVAFLLGHVAFAVAFLVRGIDPAATAVAVVPLALVGAFIVRRLWPNIPVKLRGPVVAYFVVITTMVALSFGAWRAGAGPLVPAAAVAFWLSDLSVARDRFTNAGFWNRLWGVPLYYVAQLAFAVTAAGAG
jgi:uncharacterized membrane protein YhhN